MTDLAVQVAPDALPDVAADAYANAISTWASAGSDYPDLAFVIVPRSDRWETHRPYYEAKARFAERGIPTQMVTAELLGDESRLAWSIANIALAGFAKLGGIPWAIEAPPMEARDLIIGIGRSEIASVEGRRRIFGYAMAFVANGIYDQTWSFRPVADEATYLVRLREAVVEVLNDPEHIEPPERIVFHLAKRTGAAEIEAAKSALREVGIQTPVAFLRIDDSTLYDLMDASEATYAPPKGLMVHLSPYRLLLQTEGLTKVGPPHGPILIALDERSDVDAEALPALAQQAFRLAHANWRGFNARSKPVTLLYGEKLAELVGYLERVGSWDPNRLPPSLRRRPWFL